MCPLFAGRSLRIAAGSLGAKSRVRPPRRLADLSATRRRAFFRYPVRDLSIRHRPVRHTVESVKNGIPMNLMTDFRFALRSLARVKGLAITVVVTLTLGIGANAAIFSVVRGVLLRPLVNRDENRLIYIRQSAPGIGADNTTFSVPEIDDLKARVRTIAAFGDFSTVDFTMIGLGGEPRTVKAGVVG